MIRLEELSHIYHRLRRHSDSVRALDRLTLQIEPGAAVGVVGLNGAGKTTLLRLLLGYLRPTSGSVTIGELSPRSYVESFGIAHVPERVAIPPQWTVEGALRAYALLGNTDSALAEQVESALRALGLMTVRTRRVGDLSKGNLQRLALAQAVLCGRRLMILDEPTDGLDPLWIAELRSLLGRWRSADAERVVVIASHNLPFVAQVVDRVLILDRGRLSAELPVGPGSPPLEEAFLQLAREGGRGA